MNEQFNNNMRGVLFKNNKEKDSSPDYKGEAEVAGVKYWLSCWVNTSAAGSKFMSIRFNPKGPTGRLTGAHPPVKAGSQHPAPEDFNDEIPF